MKQQKPASPLIVWIVWGAMLMTLVIYLVVLYVVVGMDSTPQPAARSIDTLRLAFGAIGLTTVGAVFWLRRITFFTPFRNGTIDTADALSAKYFSTCILSWAMSEAVAIDGFVLTMLSHQLMYYAIFAAPSVILYLLFRPRLTHYLDEFEARKQAERQTHQPQPEPAADDNGAVW